MERVKVGIAGVGKMGCLHLEKYLHLAERAEVVGVFDTDAHRAEKVAKYFNVRAYSSLPDLLIDVDALSITSSTNSHFAIAQAALQSKVHVLIEKPMVSSLTQAIQLAEAARASGVVAQVGFIERFRMASLGQGRKFEKIKWIQGQRLSTSMNRESGVDVIFDLMIHDLDLVLNILGEDPLRVVARGTTLLSKHIDLATAQLEFPSGIIAQLSASRVAHRNCREFQVVTEDCVYHFDFLVNQCTRLAFRDGVRGETDLFEQKDLDCLQIEITDFIHAIRHKRTPVVGIGEGIRSLGVCERILGQIEPGTITESNESLIPSSFYS